MSSIFPSGIHQDRPAPAVSTHACRTTFLLACVSLLFAIKFAIYGWFITPLWEIPDEPGHASYIEDLRQGTYPTIGTTRITPDIAESWRGHGGRPPLNWIAQHPPLYYALAAPAPMVAATLGANTEERVRSMRLVTAVISGLALLGLGLFMREATTNATLAMAAIVFTGATPMFLHLSSGVTHDTLVAATVCWSAYYAARWIRSDRLADAFLCAFFAGLCTITKITGLAVAVPLFAMMAYRIVLTMRERSLGNRISITTAVWLLMFAAISAWMLRNMIVFDSPLPDARMLKELDPKEIGFFAYMLQYPIWQTVFLNFIAWIGWTGQSQGAVNFIQANGLVAGYFSAALLSLSFFAFTRAFAVRETDRPWTVAFLASAAASVVAALLLQPAQLAMLTCIALFAAIAASGLSSVHLMLKGPGGHWLVATSAVVSVTFGFLYYHRTWDGFLDYGTAKALHGRYFYTLLPFMGFLLLRQMRTGRLPMAALLISVASLPIGEAFYLHQVFSMYGQA